MQFDLELFKESLESDAKDLEDFRVLFHNFINNISDDYIEIAYPKYEAFIDKFCNGNHNQENMRAFTTVVLIKYAYEQGLTDGKGN